MVAPLLSLTYTKTGLLSLCLLVFAFGGPVFSGPNDLFYPSRSDWEQSNGKVNISIFVFNDLNENGIYDLGDRALSGIATGLSQNDEPITIARSNGNGFANYATSVLDESAVLDQAGRFEFEVFSPPGWRISTQNQTQFRQLSEIPGSIAGLGLSEMLEPVGLVRYKFIRGTFSMPTGAELLLLQDGATIARANLSPGEQFLWPVERGVYELVSGAVRRSVKVGDNPVDIGILSPSPLALADGQMINFDDMAASGLQKAPNGYGGLSWFNLNIMGANYTPDSIGYVNGATSGNNILYTSSGHPATIYADEAFDFISANLTLGWPEAETEELVFEYYRGDELVMTDRIGLSAFGPINYQPRIQGVTRIKLSTAHYWQAALDDLVIYQP